MTDADTGLNVCQMTPNHSRLIDLKADTLPNVNGPVVVAFDKAAQLKAGR